MAELNVVPTLPKHNLRSHKVFQWYLTVYVLGWEQKIEHRIGCWHKIRIAVPSHCVKCVFWLVRTQFRFSANSQ
jgi:hypothetical protein